MPSASSAASIIVPTYQEVANLGMLVERLFAALSAAGIEAELILVDDDSQDGTEELIESMKGRYPVRLIVRKGQRGLASAVLSGFAAARYDRLVVLDADLQHPPELIPELLRCLNRNDCDFVIGTRYAGSGGIVDEWPIRRRISSWIATLLARPLAPLSDPMSGFFALHRRTWAEAARVDPIGYKIGLELYVKGGCRRPAEVPIRFEARSAGKSKLTVAEQLRFLRHLFALYRYRYPRISLFVGLVFVAAILFSFLRKWSFPSVRLR